MELSRDKLSREWHDFQFLKLRAFHGKPYLLYKKHSPVTYHKNRYGYVFLKHIEEPLQTMQSFNQYTKYQLFLVWEPKVCDKTIMVIVCPRVWVYSSIICVDCLIRLAFMKNLLTVNQHCHYLIMWLHSILLGGNRQSWFSKVLISEVILLDGQH